ncbi:serine/threonine-protein phosphatase [Chloracidobacterium validum]|uniref:Serine/threonine-protein phosphatase n=1 Tax=Chloracidobacterium validum TaxID=2821543 RepID=A0ABX8BBV2_9BACT|nr:PP2C family serine/threonine-protein phosphatase [Chloracidobacterium validum]QUW04323.1 serine/threonine-protein phosphatase [Chloracidobacterium validum]
MRSVGNVSVTYPKLTIAMLSDVGCRRQVNEDFALYESPPPTSLEAARKGMLALVADGLGGHVGGEIASQMAAEIVRHVYYAESGEPEAVLRQAFVEANRMIWETAQRRPALRGMGTTCTALVIRGDEAFAAHVGDTRLYLVRDGSIYQMTEDDSEVMAYVRAGRMTRAAAEQHPEKNVLLKALGTKPDLTPSLWQRPLRVCCGDRFLLTSDGLHDLVTDDEMRALAHELAPEEACQRLVELARSRGGPDNVTVGIVWASYQNGASHVDVPSPAVPRETREVRVGS